MARKEKEINLKDANVEELHRQLDKNKQELFKLRFRAASAPITNTMQIRKLRKDVARILTFINQKKGVAV
jgi:large subunit ribosomal protein L29